MNLNKRHFFYAGATGVWLLANKALAYSHTAKECAAAADRQGLPDVQHDALREFDAVQRPLSMLSEEGPFVEATGLRDCLSPAPSASSGHSEASRTFTISTSNALEQLRVIPDTYHSKATYEDNFLSLSGARCIFYHFLTLIYLFSRVEITVKNIFREEAGHKKIVYTADCTRRFITRSFPLRQLFLPEAINCEVRTTCHVEGGLVTHHQDLYTKLDVSWKLQLPSLWGITKYIAGMTYTYLLNGFYFVFDLLFIVTNKLGLAIQ